MADMMQETTTVLYYLDPLNAPHSQVFTGPDQLPNALVKASELRKSGLARFVVTSTENVDSVGKPGVNAVKDGVLPSGDPYEWKKRR